MTLVKTLQAVEETQLLTKLSSYDRLIFIGEPEILAYIQKFIHNIRQIDHNYYCELTLDNTALSNVDLEKYQAIIVASFKNENSIFEEVKQKLKTLELNIPILELFGDIFINLICQKYLLQPTLNEQQKPKLSYAIFTTPRSGSTYLCELLNSTKIAGYPTEHLRLATQELACNCNFDYFRLLNNLMQCRITNNSVFGTKFISHFLFDLQRAKPDFKQIFNYIDKFILLVRKDKIAQAVSIVLAHQTNIWHLHNNNKNIDYQSKLRDITINNDLLADVEQKYTAITNQEARLKKILENNQVKPLEIIYEDIVANPKLQINKILDFLEIVRPQEQEIQITSSVQKMPSDISQEIIRQFKLRKSAVS